MLCLIQNKTVEATKCSVGKIVFKSEDCNRHACGEGKLFLANEDFTIVKEKFFTHVSCFPDEIIPVEPTSTVSEENAEEECEEYEGDNVVTIPMNINVNNVSSSAYLI